MGAAAALVVAQVAFAVAPLTGAPPELLAVLGVLLACAVVAATALPLADVPALLVPGLLGAVVLVAALEAAGAGAAATPLEALAWGGAGVAFATVLGTPLLAVALPLFVAGVDLATSVGATAGADVPGAVAPGDALVLTLPGASGRIGAAELALLGAFAALTRRYALREAATLGAMAAGLLLAVLAGPLPALALLAAGALVPNADRLPSLLRRER